VVRAVVRNVPSAVEKALKQKALRTGTSLNTVLIEALAREAGLGSEVRYDDLDFLIGTWDPDPQFDAALRLQDQIDKDLWK
jgi:hypothetical protein